MPARMSGTWPIWFRLLNCADCSCGTTKMPGNSRCSPLANWSRPIPGASRMNTPVPPVVCFGAMCCAVRRLIATPSPGLVNEKNKGGNATRPTTRMGTVPPSAPVGTVPPMCVCRALIVCVPSAISFGPVGSRPSMSAGPTSPRRLSSASPTVPRSPTRALKTDPRAYPETSEFPSTEATSRFAPDPGFVALPGANTSMLQVRPESAGLVSRRFRLAPNDSAAASAIMVTAAPNTAVRTGTAVRPAPGSSAMRTPARPLGGNDRMAVDAPRRRPLGAAVPCAVHLADAARQTGIAPARTVRTATPATPTPRTSPSRANPGCGSAIRAIPVGVSGDSRYPTTAATSAPTMPIRTTRTMPTTNSSDGVMPSERSVGYSIDSRKVWRARAWAKMARPATATSAARIHSATASARVASCTPPVWLAWVKVMPTLFPGWGRPRLIPWSASLKCGTAASPPSSVVTMSRSSAGMYCAWALAKPAET